MVSPMMFLWIVFSLSGLSAATAVTAATAVATAAATAVATAAATAVATAAATAAATAEPWLIVDVRNLTDMRLHRSSMKHWACSRSADQRGSPKGLPCTIVLQTPDDTFSSENGARHDKDRRDWYSVSTFQHAAAKSFFLCHGPLVAGLAAAVAVGKQVTEICAFGSLPAAFGSLPAAAGMADTMSTKTSRSSKTNIKNENITATRAARGHHGVRKKTTEHTETATLGKKQQTDCASDAAISSSMQAANVATATGPAKTEALDHAVVTPKRKKGCNDETEATSALLNDGKLLQQPVPRPDVVVTGAAAHIAYAFRAPASNAVENVGKADDEFSEACRRRTDEDLAGSDTRTLLGAGSALTQGRAALSRTRTGGRSESSAAKATVLYSENKDANSMSTTCHWNMGTQERPTFLEVHLRQCRMRKCQPRVGEQPVPTDYGDQRSLPLREAPWEARTGRPGAPVCRPTMDTRQTSGLKDGDRQAVAGAGAGDYRGDFGITPAASWLPQVSQVSDVLRRRHVTKTPEKIPSQLLWSRERRRTHGGRRSGALDKVHEYSPNQAFRRDQVADNSKAISEFKYGAPAPKWDKTYYSIVAQTFMGVKKRVFGDRQDDSERGQSKGWSHRRLLLLLRGDGWQWLMWLWVFDNCFNEWYMGWRDKQKGGRRRGQPRSNAFAVHAILFLLLSPVPVCQAVSCTTKIRDLVTSQPGIAKIDKNVCSEGTLPPDIGKLAKLKGLYLGNTKLSGTMPPDIGKLAALASLGLHYTQISGTIPPDVGRLKSLQTLDISQTSTWDPSCECYKGGLSGTLPPDIGKLVALKYLWLQGTDISGTLPPDIGKLAKLTWLDLAGTKVAGTLPPDIGKMVALKELYLAGTKISGPVPSSMPALTSCSLPDKYITTNKTWSTLSNNRSCPALQNCGSITKYRACRDGGPGSKSCMGTPCALGTDFDYCGPRVLCPKGSEARAGLTGGMEVCSGYKGGPVNVCAMCPKGRYKDKDATQDERLSLCEPCSPGTYADGQGSTKCKACPAGRYSNVQQSTSLDVCFLCTSGRYSATEAAPSVNSCVGCAKGKANALAGQANETACLQCAKGRFQTTTGQASCEACAAGRYRDVQGGLTAYNPTTGCKTCDKGKYSSAQGATAESQCNSCPLGRFSVHIGATNISTCDPCPAGKKGKASGKGAETEGCQACSGGDEYQDQGGQVSCIPFACPKGQYGKSNFTVADKPPSCTNCSKGKFGPVRGLKEENDCNQCPPGTGGNKTGAVDAADCGQCAPGWYSPGGTDCTRCPSGTFSDEVQSSYCTDCPAGTFGGSPGLTTANCSGLCPPGTSSSKGFSKCEPCRLGEISEQSGATRCESCPVGQTTLGEGSTECVCQRGSYGVKTGTDLVCTQCTPVSMNCTVAGATLAELPLAEGYWRSDDMTSSILKCPINDTCVSTASTASSVYSVAANSSCAEGQKGILCAVCSNGWHRRQSGTRCTKCPTESGANIALSLLVLFAAGLLLWLFLWYSRNQEGGKLRPLINGWQSLTVVLMTGRDWPEVVTVVQTYVLSSLNFDVASMASPSCLGFTVNFYGKFTFMIAVSLLVIGVPWLASYTLYKLVHKNDEVWAKVKKARLHDTVILVLLVYTTITAQAFYHFRCQTVISTDKTTRNTTETSYLMADYNIKCFDSRWSAMLVLVLAVLVLFSAGLPLANAIFLWRNRQKLHEPAFNNIWGTMYDLYKDEAYLYESASMGFKLLLLMALVLFEHGSMFQLASVLLVAAAQLAVHAKVLPFKDKLANNLQFCGTALSFLTAFGGLMLGYLKLEQKEAYARTMGEEQELLNVKYTMQTNTVKVGIDVATLCVFAAYAFLGGREVYRKRQQIRARTSSVRAAVVSLRRPSVRERLVKRLVSGKKKKEQAEGEAGRGGERELVVGEGRGAGGSSRNSRNSPRLFSAVTPTSMTARLGSADLDDCEAAGGEGGAGDVERAWSDNPLVGEPTRAIHKAIGDEDL